MSLEEEIFKPARKSLLEQQGGREQVIRACREITSYSKKAIFTLHRADSQPELISSELISYLDAISKQLKVVNSISMQNQSLRGSIAGAVEEMVEFFTFGYYKYHGGLMSYVEFSKVVDLLMSSRPQDVVLYIMREQELPSDVETHSLEFIDQCDYLMGLFDCTGEVMRMVISSSTNNAGALEMNKTLSNYKFLMQLYKHYTVLTACYPGISINHGAFDDAPNSKSNIAFKKKLSVFQASIKKIETCLVDLLISDKEIL
ncbi:uncharacterized protein LODBEIA_P39420 [Lodderomyces beijingensis]|uniref:Translin n=1 Tax=Lodderomyces beijingensis TaxID=1775926 RepID=A0ABP0ZNH8_9ASCO